MEIKFTVKHALFIIIGVIIIVLDFLIFFKEDSRFFKPILVLAFVIGALQFILDFLKENKRQKEVEQKFLEFSRALVQSVKSGIPIPKAVLEISKEHYGALDPHVKKLANQIEWGFPLHQALLQFSKDTKNPVIKKSISIVIEAEKSGGNMGDVLQAVTDSVFSIKKIKEERRSRAYTQVVQGYIIFFVFIIILLILQIYLIPKISTISQDISAGLSGMPFGKGGATEMSIEYINKVAMWLGIIQGFFAGLLIGKFSEGEIKMGIKHSLILMVFGYILTSTFGTI
jgi:flagellar protein FlaJ